MSNRPLHTVLPFLRRIVSSECRDTSDAQLLERFLTLREDAAFEQLVVRHGRMVLGVCRRVLHDEHAAEDAFQAAFLALACRAASIRHQASVGGWLYRVAYRIALDARSHALRQAAREQPLDDAPASSDPQTDAMDRELRQVLDAEVNRLPEKYRVPFLRCCCEGETSAAVARDLGCPVGTVESWLTRARQRLRTGLARRGV
jgi:RNA polymerase sigma factor (sigma-70 family)